MPTIVTAAGRKVELYEGTLIHATLLPRDLFRAFRGEVIRLGGKGPKGVPTVPKDEWYETEKCQEMISEMENTLNEIASKHEMRFGAHEGDGSDFGFWKDD